MINVPFNLNVPLKPVPAAPEHAKQAVSKWNALQKECIFSFLIYRENM